MSKFLLLSVLVLSNVLFAQQPNLSGVASQSINGRIAGPFPIRGVTVFTGVNLDVRIEGSPNQPFLTYQSTALNSQGFMVLGNQLVDILAANAILIWNGGIDPTFHTDATGDYSVQIPIASNTAINTTRAFQTLIADPAAMGGARLTAATEITTQRGIVTANPAMGDDVTATVSLSAQSFAFTFYGVSYSTLFLNSNGNLTFNSGDTTFTPTPAQMLSGNPRIAMFWTDLVPATGQVTTTFDLSVTPPTLLINFNGVPSFANVGTHFFRATLTADPLNQIDLFYPSANPGAGFEQLTGISPGTNRSPTTTETDLGAAISSPVVGNPLQALFEFYGLTSFPNWPAGRPSNPYDLSGRTLTFFPAGVNDYLLTAL